MRTECCKAYLGTHDNVLVCRKCGQENPHLSHVDPELKVLNDRFTPCGLNNDEPGLDMDNELAGPLTAEQAIEKAEHHIITQETS